MNICLNSGVLYTGVVSIFGEVGREYSNYFCHFTEDLQEMSDSEKKFAHINLCKNALYIFSRSNI